uniref:PB1 domain-containing protein n=1 Tax=Stegastes partitus TaxID=144197 RepID=A0A3B4ZWX9_9TELE
MILFTVSVVANTSVMLLGVILSPEEIRLVTLEDIPPSVDELCVKLCNTLGLRGNFILQFEDPDFGNQLCNLTDIKELPNERATLKVLFTSYEGISDSTLDTVSFGSPSSCDSTEWPDPFVIPAFSHDVVFQLRAANDAYAQDGTVMMIISNGVKSEILDRLVDIISKITAYPNKDHYESVAKALVSMHLCLREPGSGKGWYCWVFSLRFKMGNYRQKMMAAGCPKVLVNKGKRVEEKCKPVKKSKKGEIHYVPEPPEGQTTVKSEKDRETMVLEVQKRDPDLQLLDKLMLATFSQRRKEIIGDFCCHGQMEFSRIVTKDLLESFLEGLDLMVPSLFEAYKAASGRMLTLSGDLCTVFKRRQVLYRETILNDVN